MSNTGTTNYCTHTSDGSICDDCMGPLDYVSDVKCGGLHPQPYVDPALIARCQPFADLIRKTRKDAGLDLLNLADALGWSTPMLSAVERARQAPPSLGNADAERYADWFRDMTYLLFHIGDNGPYDEVERLALMAAGEGLYWCKEEQSVKIIREDADFCPSCGVSGESLYPWAHISQKIKEAMDGGFARTTWEKQYPNHCRACLGSGLTDGIACPWCRAKGKQCPRCAHTTKPWGYSDCANCGWTTTADFLPPLTEEQRAACLGNVRLIPQ